MKNHLTTRLLSFFVGPQNVKMILSILVQSSSILSSNFSTNSTEQQVIS